jgi:hypothetical protein
LEECGPCPVFAGFILAFALQLRKKHGKTSVRVRETSVRVRKASVRIRTTTVILLYQYEIGYMSFCIDAPEKIPSDRASIPGPSV